MNFDLQVNGASLLSGDLAIIIIGLMVFLGLVFTIAKTLWDKLRENERLKSEFIAIIAHKFRTPLTKVKWISEGLLADETEPYRRESISDMQKANESLIKLTSALIEMTDDDASRTSYHFERLSLCTLVQQIADSMKSSFHEKNLFFSVKCSPQDIAVSADRARLTFVVETLLDNARIYTPPGRNIEVTVGRSGRKAMVSVTDHGIGIDGPDMAHIFTKFFRADNARRTDTEGFGVALHLSQEIILRHKGKISVYSDGMDRGATFTLALPAVR